MLNIILDGSFLIILILCVSAKLKRIQEKTRKENNVFLEKSANIIFGFIFLLSMIILMFKLGSIPQGLHVDEAGALYDAICLSRYGVDRYLYKLPVYFINFGGGQNALYTYLAAIMVKIFGINTFVFRMPAVILSLLSVFCLYKMINENNSKKEALFTTFILVICPYFIMKSRWGLESYLMGSLLTISTFVLMKTLNFGKRYQFVLAGIFFGFTLYTYAIAYMVVPMILGIVLLYMLLIQKIDWKNIFIMGIPLAILALPLMMMLAFNSGVLENATIPGFSIPKLWFYRGGEISISNIPENLKNIFELLFVKDFLNYNSIETFGTIYKLSIPLVFFGLIETTKNVIEKIKRKEFSLDFMMLVTFIVVLLVSLCVTELNINKMNAIYIPMIYFAGKFVLFIVNHIKYSWMIVIVLYGINAGLFLKDYFTEFAKADLLYFEQDIIQASKKAEELNKEKIYVENCLNQTYIYTLIATPISPYEWNENLQIENGIVTKYGKYQFYIPQEIEKNAVYIIKNDNQKINELIEDGFEVEQFGEFYVIWEEKEKI